MCRWAQVLEDKDLSDPTSNTAIISSFEPTSAYPAPFSWSYSSNQATLLYIKRLQKSTKTVSSIRRTITRGAIYNLVGKLTDRKPAFSIHVSDCIRIGLTPENGVNTAVLHHGTYLGELPFCARKLKLSNLGHTHLMATERLLNPFRTAVPFWGQTSQKLSDLSPNRDCSTKLRLIS